MARKIRFPLKMKNGAEVRTLDELKENFDLESILGYFTDGKLQTWLADRYYDEKAETVATLSAEMPDLNQKLCEILEVEYQAEADETDLELIQRRNEKLRILSAVTADKEILDNIDFVAMNQDELFDILDEDTDKVYLYGERFEIPLGRKNTIYEGINSPLVILESNKDIFNYEEAGIRFKNVLYEKHINPYITKGEKLFLEGRQQEAFPLIEQAANNGDPRAMYIMARYCNDGYETVKINEIERNNWCEKAYSYKEPLSMYGYAAWCLNGKQDEENKIYSQIFNDIKFLAESDDALAQGIIGWMYDTGHGVEKDEIKAVEWYRKAAEQGFAYGQCNLGFMYDSGYGVTQDYAEAVKWYRKAAEQGYARAQCNLAYMYRNGLGVTQDYAESLKWSLKAAEQGDACGQCNLGYMYETGRGVTKDYAEAVKWYRKAAEQGYAYAQCNLGYMYETGRGVTKDYSEAAKWYRKAADQSDSRGQFNLGECYYLGWGVNKNETRAIDLYRKSAEQGYWKALLKLADFYSECNGFGPVKSDYSKAGELYIKAAEQGYADAQYSCGYFFKGNHIGEHRDIAEAIKWYKKAAAQGHINAKKDLDFLLKLKGGKV